MTAMKESVRRFITLVCAASAVLMLCLATFFLISGGSDNFSVGAFGILLMLNLPICILMVYVDLRVARITSRLRRLPPILKLLTDLTVTGIIIASVCALANILYYRDIHIDLPREILPSILLGGIIMLCVEFYLLGLKQSSESKLLAETEREKAKYQYEALKNQINPHFLFNCLNVVASLAYEDADKTNIFTKRLSNVYRYLLTTRTKPVVPLAEELKFAKEYAYLQQIRFEDNLRITIIDPGTCDAEMTIPASIQMSVENAIKHNVCDSMNPLEITIEVNPGGVTIRNSLSLRNGAEGSGTGIANLREQFRRNGADIRITETGSEYIVYLPFIHPDRVPQALL